MSHQQSRLVRLVQPEVVDEPIAVAIGSARAGTIPEQFLFNRSQQYDDRGNSRGQSTSARQAAEALFAPNPQRVEPTVREAAPAGEAVRKPRVLAVAAAVPVRHDELDAPISAQPSMKPVIPAAHVARIRACLQYGMTAAQVAEMYGVAASEVERILRFA